MAEVLPYRNINICSENDPKVDLSHRLSQHVVIHEMGQRQWHQLVLVRLQLQPIDWIRRNKFTFFLQPISAKKTNASVHDARFGVWEPFFYLPSIPVTPNFFLPLSPSQALKTDSEVDTLTARLWKLPPTQKIKGLDLVHVYLESHTFNSKYHKDNVLLSFTSKFTQQLVCGFWHPPKAALPESQHVKRKGQVSIHFTCLAGRGKRRVWLTGGAREDYINSGRLGRKKLGWAFTLMCH